MYTGLYTGMYTGMYTDMYTCTFFLLTFVLSFVHLGAVPKAPKAEELRFKTKNDGYVS